jgi:phosphoribosylaminoimidazole-succinocarboxamide synthase
METNYQTTPSFFQKVKEGLIALGLTFVASGKVRDIYSYNNQMILITTDRISAFDVVSKQTIPYKGQVLNGIAAHFLNDAKSICPVWLTDTPNQNTSIGHGCVPFQVEMVTRNLLCGSAWRTYKEGGRLISGVVMPEDMYEYKHFPEPIITPTTKAVSGHDEEISRSEIIETGLVPSSEYELLEKYTRAIFEHGIELAEDRDLMLADTKYEFGFDKDGTIRLIDEVHTPDSSRYFLLLNFYRRKRENKPQQQLSKEFLREWLMDQGYNGQPEKSFPHMPDSLIKEVSDRYKYLYGALTGVEFVEENLTVEEFVSSIKKSLSI